MPAPKRDQFKAGEVCEMAQLQPYVLRSWEAEFPRLGRPAENGSARIYRRHDVELVLRIKQLVFGEGLTLAGARRRLEEEHEESTAASSSVDDALDDLARNRLRQIREGLEEIVAMLARDHPSGAPPLELVPPPGESPAASRKGERGKSKSQAKGNTKGRR